MRPLLVLLVTALLLPGCASKDKAGTSATTGPSTAMDMHGGHGAGDHLLAPLWQLGDYWTMDSPQGGTFSHVVSKDAGEDWILDTDEPNLAFFDARSDISFLGKVRKSDLAGSQGDKRVEFLKFPLQPHLNWTTDWDGERMSIHVLEVKDGKASLSAMRASGSKYADYTYSDQARYFTHFAFYDPKGDAVAFEWTLSHSGSGFANPLTRWTLDELFTATGQVPMGRGTAFTVKAGYTDVYIVGDLQCSAGAVQIAVGPPTGPAENRGYSNQGPCPLVDTDSYSVTAPPQDENWGALINAAPTTTATLELHVYGRTLVQFPVGQAPS